MKQFCFYCKSVLKSDAGAWIKRAPQDVNICDKFVKRKQKTCSPNRPPCGTPVASISGAPADHIKTIYDLQVNNIFVSHNSCDVRWKMISMRRVERSRNSRLQIKRMRSLANCPWSFIFNLPNTSTYYWLDAKLIKVILPTNWYLCMHYVWLQSFTIVNSYILNVRCLSTFLSYAAFSGAINYLSSKQ